jgi:CRP-like cAMP-binding protein
VTTTLNFAASGHRSFVRVLEVDPELAAGLTEEERRRASKHLLARVTTLPAGRWDLARDCPPQGAGSLGMLVVDGLLGRRVTVRGGSSLELLGAGDITRPWEGDREPDDAPRSASWSVLSTTEAAWLDDEFARVAARWPEITAQLIRRATQRASRLACQLAISHVVGVEIRVLRLLGHMAERWGRVTPEGVLVPIPLTNEMLGWLIGARPPSISTALQKLAHAELLVRGPDGSWLLRDHAVVQDAAPGAAEVSA